MLRIPSAVAIIGIVGAIAASIPASARANIYMFVDERGVVHLNDHPIDARYRLVIGDPAPAGPAASSPAPARADSRAYEPLIVEASQRYGVPANLVRAVIHVESGFNSRAVSPKGATGLMQLMPGTAARYGVADRTNAAQNIHGGTRYLSDLLTLFKQDLRLALAAYNAGEEAVLRYRRVPPYAETRNYVERVLANYRATGPS